MQVRILLIAVGILTICQTAPAQRSSWPMIGGDAAQTSNADIDLTFPLEIAETWEFSFGSEQGMIVTEDYLVLIDPADSNVVYGVDARTGDSLWQFYVPNTGGSANYIPAAWEDIVIVSGQGAPGIYALNIKDGTELWSRPTGSGYTRCPLISDGLLFAPSGSGLYCIDLATETDLWEILGTMPQISPVADDSSLYFGMGGEVHSVNKWTGDSLWSVSVPNGTFSSYSLDETRLYVSEYRTQINALNKQNGAVLWTVMLDTNEIMIDYPSCFAQTDDYLVVRFLVEGDDRNNYMVLDKATGAEINRFRGGAMYYGSPTIVNDAVVDFRSGSLLFTSLTTGDTAYWMHMPDTWLTYQVIAANDGLYIGASGPTIHVLRSSSTSIQQPDFQASLEIYPNPTYDILNLNIELYRSSPLEFEIVTVDGKIVHREQLGRISQGTLRHSHEISSLKPGLYVVRLEGERGYIVQSFVKQ